jgi:hypothetical protein
MSTRKSTQKPKLLKGTSTSKPMRSGTEIRTYISSPTCTRSHTVLVVDSGRRKHFIALASLVVSSALLPSALLSSFAASFRTFVRISCGVPHFAVPLLISFSSTESRHHALFAPSSSGSTPSAL